MNSNIDVEKIVLGTLISFPNIYPKLKSKLSINLFTEEVHQIIFETIDNLWQNNKPIDIILLSKELAFGGKKELEKYVVDLVVRASSTVNIEYYLMILVELSIKRDFIHKFTILTNLAKQEEQDIFDLRDKAFEFFDNLFIEKFIEANREYNTFPELVQKVEEKFRKITNGDYGGITGIASSLDVINKAFGGWQNSDLTIVAGRPGMGKTAFIVQQIVDISKQNMAVGVFSLEMSAEQISARIVTNFTNIKNSSILRKGLNQEELQRYWDCKDDMLKMNIHIDDTPALSIQDIRLKAKMMKIRHNIKVLFVDYLQLVTHEKSKTREQEISKISQGLKSIAKELDIPVIALSQLSREVEKRPNKRPQLSDLRDSGSIEQDADAVIFLYRPEYYNIDEWTEYDNEPTKNEIEIIIAKNRHGGLLPERCEVNLSTSSFYNL
ncbi:replicative DNA helicase [Riemerella anatipestifer]|uniref:replicative DNA helicase n=1 Tax=Riemerella anatipestifer TaxID=34085 RepID=UPI000699DCAD|nr:replicative DNA helicase [Riemerella anatipestifer]MDR7694132.1 replicative DNA helicase [Riemerella anatipestifer]